MFALLRTGSVLAAMTLALPATADAQWFDWGWNWGWQPGYYQPAGAWTTYYPGGGGYRGYGGGYGYAGGYYAPGGGCCDPCGCNPCGSCDPCGSACGAGGCASGNCAGGNCAYDAPAGGAPLPDPNIDAPPLRSRTTPTPRGTPRDADDAQTFESPTRGRDPMPPLDDPGTRSRGRGFDPIDTETNPLDGAGSAPRSSTPARPRNFEDNSTAPAGGTRSPRSGTGTNDGLLDPANDPGFSGSKKIEIPEADETVIRPRTPVKTPEVNDGQDAGIGGPRLDLKSTSAPVIQKTRLASHARNATAAAPRIAKTPVIRDWSAAMSDARAVR